MTVRATQRIVVPTAKACRGGPQPQTPASEILRLQRSAGNRAVSRLLARVTDSRLEYATPAAAAEVAEHAGRRLPFDDPRNPMRGWNGPDILSNLTQIDSSGLTQTDGVRCAANAVLAIAILSGPRRVYQLALSLADAGGARADAMGTSRAVNTLNLLLRALAAAERIERGTATYDDLDTLADAMKASMSASALAFTGVREIPALARLVGRTEYKREVVASRATMQERLDDMEPGDAYVVLVDTDVLAEGTLAAMGQGNHFVTVMRDLDGRARGRLLYDPWPRTGAQLISSGSHDFWDYFTTADGRWKWLMLATLTHVPQSRR